MQRKLWMAFAIWLCFLIGITAVLIYLGVADGLFSTPVLALPPLFWIALLAAIAILVIPLIGLRQFISNVETKTNSVSYQAPVGLLIMGAIMLTGLALMYLIVEPNLGGGIVLMGTLGLYNAFLGYRIWAAFRSSK